MRKSIIILVLFLIARTALAFDHTHQEFDRLLNQFVVETGSQTAVDYTALKQSIAPLDHYLDVLQTVSTHDFEQWSRNEQMAFLINTYNAFTLKLILNHYPEIDSIRDLGGLVFSSPWKKKFFTLFGKEATLHFIEHDLLRDRYKDPRIHFAINCASRGCPPLQKQAYIATSLDKQLEAATTAFIRDPERNRYVAEKNRLEISKIFSWYVRDFIRHSGSIESYIAPYITDDPELRKLIQTQSTRIDYKIQYLDYDWSLNDINRN